MSGIAEFLLAEIVYLKTRPIYALFIKTTFSV